MGCLTTNFKSSPYDFKLYYSNLIRSNRYIDYNQKTRRDCVVSFSIIKVIIKEEKLLYHM